MPKKTFRVGYALATPEDLETAKRLSGVVIGLNVPDGTLTLNPKDVTDEDVRRIADTIAAIPDQSARESAIRHLAESLVHVLRDGRHLAATLLAIDRKNRESQKQFLTDMRRPPSK